MDKAMVGEKRLHVRPVAHRHCFTVRPCFKVTAPVSPCAGAGKPWRRLKAQLVGGSAPGGRRSS